MSSHGKIYAISGAIVLLLCGVASVEAAQGTPSGQNGQGSQPSAQNGSTSMTIRQQIQQNLTQAGYTDVNVMPSSFYIHAKDKQGHPVAMVIGPDTFTEVTEVPRTSGASSGNATSGTGNAAPASQP